MEFLIEIHLSRCILQVVPDGPVLKQEKQIIDEIEKLH